MAIPEYTNLSNVDSPVDKQDIKEHEPFIENNSFGEAYSANNLDISKYNNISKGGIVPYSPDSNYKSALDETRARNQSISGLVVNAAVQTLTNALGSLVSSAGALGHPAAIMSKEYQDNALDRIGKAITSWGENVAPIYQTKKAQEGFAPFDATWLASGTPGVIGSLAMMLPGTGIVKGVGLLGKGLAAVENVNKITNAIKTTGTFLEANMATASFGAALTGGIINNHINSYITASQQYNELFSQAKDLGMNQEEAEEYAGDGARRTYDINLANIGFDVAELSLLMKGTSYLNRGLSNLKNAEKEAAFDFTKKETNNLIDKSISDAVDQTIAKPANWKNTIGEYAKVAGVGSAFQLIMNVANNEGKYYVETKYGINTDNSSVGDRIADDLTSKAALQGVFWGIVGGVIMKLGSNKMNDFLFKDHYDNEENRITNAINKATELKTKLKIIQDFQADDNNYEAEQVHQSLINNIVADGVKNGVMDLHLKTLENLSRVNFNGLDEEQKRVLLDQGFNENSPKIAQDIYTSAKDAKNIFDKHFKKNYLNDVILKDNIFNNEEMKIYLSSVAGSIDANIATRDKIINKAFKEQEEIKKGITKNTNGRDNPSVPAYVESLTTQKSTEININNTTEEINEHNKQIDLARGILINLQNKAKINSDRLGKPIAVDKDTELMLNSVIDGHNISLNELNKRLLEYKEIKKTADEDVKQHETNLQNFKDNVTNINTENYTKKSTTYSQNTVDELEKTLKDKDYISNAAKLSSIEKQIQSLNRAQEADKKYLDDFIKNPKKRQEIANNAIDNHKNQINIKKDTFAKVYDQINKNGDTDSVITQTKDFIDKSKKEPYSAEIVKKAQDDLKGLNKRKEDEIKTKKIQQDKEQKENNFKKNVVANEVIKSNTPRENKDIIAKDNNSLTIPINKPINNIKLDSELKPEHTTNIPPKGNIESYSPVNYKILKNDKINPSELELHNNVINFFKELHTNFAVTKDNVTARTKKTKEDLINSINNLNELKGKIIDNINTKSKDLPLNTENDKPLYDTLLNNINRVIDKVNSFVDNVNITLKEPEKLTFDLSPKKARETAETIANIIKFNNPDVSQRVIQRNDILNSINQIFKETEPDKIKQAQEVAKTKVETLLKDSNIEHNIKFSKLFEEEPGVDINTTALKIHDLIDATNFEDALGMFFNKIARSGVLQDGHFINYKDLMTAVYRTDFDLIPIMYESVNSFLAGKSTLLKTRNINLNGQEIPLSKILDSNPAKLFVDPIKIKNSNYLSTLTSNLESIIKNTQYYEPHKGVYGQNIERKELTPITELQLNIPEDREFENYTRIISTSKKGDKVILEGDDFKLNGVTIAKLSTPDFTYNGVEYAKKVGDTYEFRNPFEHLDNKDFDNIEALQDILRDAWLGKIGKNELTRLEDGTYIKEDREGQKNLYKTYLYLLGGQTKETKLNPSNFKQLVSPLFIGNAKEQGFKLSKLEIITRLENHVNRFKEDFTKMMDIRKNPTGFEYSIENISTPDILHDTRYNEQSKSTVGVNHLLSETINPNSKILVRDLDNKSSRVLYDPITGNKSGNEVKEKNINNEDSDVLYIGLKHTYDVIIPHRLYVSNLVDGSIQDTTGKYKDYTTKAKEFIKNELVNFITNKVPKDDITSRITNLKKLIITDNGNLTFFPDSPDNITFNITLPFDKNSTENRNKKIKIERNKDGKFNIYIADRSNLKDSDKAIIDRSAAAKFNDYSSAVKNREGNINFNERDLREQLDLYVPHMLRNFHYDGTKLDLTGLNDTGDIKYNNTLFDPIDRYNEDGSLKSLNIRKKYDTSQYGHPYLDYVIETGAVKSNIGAVKDGNYVISNFNLGSNSEHNLAIHIKADRIEQEEHPINSKTVKNTEDLKSIPEFKDFNILLHELNPIEPLAIKFDGYSPDGKSAGYISGTTIHMYEKTIKDKGFDLTRELAHEVIHGLVKQESKKLELPERKDLVKESYKLRDNIKEIIKSGTVGDRKEDQLQEELTDEDKTLLNQFINSTNKTIQELYTYPFTRPNIAKALSKIKYQGDETGLDGKKIVTVWDKLRDMMYKLLGITKPTIIDNINEILNFSLTSPELNISERTVQSDIKIKPESVKTKKINKDAPINSNSNENRPTSDKRSNFSKQNKPSSKINKNSLILDNKNDYKIVNSLKFIEFNNNNLDHSLKDNIEYFKKCH
jgi:hypothetical protein